MPNNSVYISGAEEYYGIPSGLYASIIDAIGNTVNGVNASGGYGIAGITPEIASTYGGNRLNVNQNIITGAKYLSALYKTTGNWNDAAKNYLSSVGVNSGNINFEFVPTDNNVGKPTANKPASSPTPAANNAPINAEQSILKRYLSPQNPFPDSASKNPDNSASKTADISIWGFLTTAFPYSSVLLAVLALLIMWYSIKSEIK